MFPGRIMNRSVFFWPLRYEKAPLSCQIITLDRLVCNIKFGTVNKYKNQ